MPARDLSRANENQVDPDRHRPDAGGFAVFGKLEIRRRAQLIEPELAERLVDCLEGCILRPPKAFLAAATRRYLAVKKESLS